MVRIIRGIENKATGEEMEELKRNCTQARRQFKVVKAKVWKLRDGHLKKMAEQHVATLKENNLLGERDVENPIKSMRTTEIIKYFKCCK